MRRLVVALALVAALAACGSSSTGPGPRHSVLVLNNGSVPELLEGWDTTLSAANPSAWSFGFDTLRAGSSECVVVPDSVAVVRLAEIADVPGANIFYYASANFSQAPGWSWVGGSAPASPTSPC